MVVDLSPGHALLEHARKKERDGDFYRAGLAYAEAKTLLVREDDVADAAAAAVSARVCAFRVSLASPSAIDPWPGDAEGVLLGLGEELTALIGWEATQIQLEQAALSCSQAFGDAGWTAASEEMRYWAQCIRREWLQARSQSGALTVDEARPPARRARSMRLIDLVCGHGQRPWRWFGWAAALVVIYAMVFAWAIPGEMSGITGCWWQRLIPALLYSTGVFTTFGLPGIEPVGQWAQFATVLEAATGYLMLSVLVGWVAVQLMHVRT